jgi:ketosteroid isomerase-like protein
VCVPSDTEAVLAVHDGWLAANETGDVAWLRENLAPDYFMINLNGALYDGLDHICRLWEYYRTTTAGWGILPGPRATAEVVHRVVRVVGDVGWVAYRFVYRGVATDMGGSFELPSRGTDVMERRDGRWLIVHGHYSVGEPGGPEGGF